MVSPFAVRLLLVILFFPVSALDESLNFAGAVAQAQRITGTPGPANALIVARLLVKTILPLGILTGEADRFPAFVMAGYCGVTALLWK